jgi:ATP-dependent Lon protease
VSDSPRGEEIIGILTHLTDTTQNDKFHDKYFSEIDFDLSKCLFIFSYNDDSKVNPILKDRMYNIETKGYNVNEKIVICKKYLIPKLDKEFDLEIDDIIISNETVKIIVERYTSYEKGVRNLKRCVETIYSKLNLYHLMGDTNKLFDENIIKDVKYPYKVTNEILEKLISIPQQSQAYTNMYL